MEQREEMDEGLNAFIALTHKYVDVEELTQTIVNEYIKKIIVFAPDKSSGKRTQNVTTHNSCQNGHIHQNTPGKPELSKVLPR